MTCSDMHTPSNKRPTAVVARRGFFGRLSHGRKKPAPRVQNSVSPAPPVGCCLFRSRRPPSKSVRFSCKVPPESDRSTVPSTSDPSHTPRVVRTRSLSSKGLRVDDPTKQGNLQRSASRKTFYTAVSSARRSPNRSTPGSITQSPGMETETAQETNVTLPRPPCICKFPAHSLYSPEMPVLTGPGIVPGSYEELLVHAQSIVGSWITMLERSQSLDEHMTYVGIGKMKRMVMNKLSIPFTAILEDGDTLLHAWITTPVGQKHTRSSLVGKQTFDQDSDLGDWTASTSIVDYSIEWFCAGRTVRAMQMERHNPKLGLCYETRVVLPDQAEGKILLYNFTLHPPPNSGKNSLTVDRLFKFVS
eukprot:Gregarina_sp_Pseudo_9__4811@NODE_502_length_2690_cov_180_804979_g473_i0_p1_GENE_NODE_502_length_2690_cov_180_804979_g473_i0NODE_502_length_2690_cov_180_804979_g473_i0_p1_ORF_typecomplete_len360_score74_62Lipocalin/PF00061_23/0_12_NODE_502_length_2690_cov_180_804979_g473_i012842363